MNNLDIGLEIGVTTGFFFVLLEIVLIGLFDMALSRIVYLIYDKEINRGKSITVKSVDIPGVTHYLIDKQHAAINVLATTAKLSLFVIVFFSILGIDSQGSLVDTEGYLRFNPCMDTSLGDAIKTQYGEYQRVCEDRSDHNYEITFFQMRIGTNGSKTICMDWKTVQVKDSKEIVKVLGCTSHVGHADCNIFKTFPAKRANLTVVRESEEFPGDKYPNAPQRLFVDYLSTDVENTWSEHDKPRLVCLRSFRSTVKREFCLLTFKEEGNTILQLWQWFGSVTEGKDELQLIFPGAVFNTSKHFNRNLLAILLYDAFDLRLHFDYASLSRRLVEISSEYVHDPEAIRPRPCFSESSSTTISVTSVALILGSFTFTIILLVISFIMSKMRSTSRFNTTDGLSCIIEENGMPRNWECPTARQSMRSHNGRKLSNGRSGERSRKESRLSMLSNSLQRQSHSGLHYVNENGIRVVDMNGSQLDVEEEPRRMSTRDDFQNDRKLEKHILEDDSQSEEVASKAKDQNSVLSSAHPSKSDLESQCSEAEVKS